MEQPGSVQTCARAVSFPWAGRGSHLRLASAFLLFCLTIAEMVSCLRLAAGSGTTLVDQMRPALGWRCRCSLFRSREAKEGTSSGVEHMGNLVWSSRSSEQGDTISTISPPLAEAVVTRPAAYPSASTRTDQADPPHSGVRVRQAREANSLHPPIR